MPEDFGRIVDHVIHDRASALLHIKRVQQLDEHLRAVRALPEMVKKDTGPCESRLSASIPTIFAEQWAKECGAAVGTQEWAKYAMRKVNDEFPAFKVHGG